MSGLPMAAVFTYLNGRGLAERYPDAKPIRGTADATDLRATAGRFIVATRSGGPGLIIEQAYDTVLVTLRCVGRQAATRDAAYTDGEKFADAVDQMMLSPGNVNVGGHRALYVVRAGGGPAHAMTDKARRAHWSCSYVIPVASGL